MMQIVKRSATTYYITIGPIGQGDSDNEQTPFFFLLACIQYRSFYTVDTFLHTIY